MATSLILTKSSCPCPYPKRYCGRGLNASAHKGSKQVAGSTVQAQYLHRRAIAGMIESGPIPALYSEDGWGWSIYDNGSSDRLGIPHHNRQADAQPRAARHGLLETLGPTAPPSASAGRDREF